MQTVFVAALFGICLVSSFLSQNLPVWFQWRLATANSSWIEVLFVLTDELFLLVFSFAAVILGFQGTKFSFVLFLSLFLHSFVDCSFYVFGLATFPVVLFSDVLVFVLICLSTASSFLSMFVAAKCHSENLQRRENQEEPISVKLLSIPKAPFVVFVLLSMLGAACSIAIIVFWDVQLGVSDFGDLTETVMHALSAFFLPGFFVVALLNPKVSLKHVFTFFLASICMCLIFGLQLVPAIASLILSMSHQAPASKTHVVYSPVPACSGAFSAAFSTIACIGAALIWAKMLKENRRDDTPIYEPLPTL